MCHCVDCMVNPDPLKISSIKYQKFWIRVNHTIRHNQKTKKRPHFFLRLEGFFWFKTSPLLSLNFCKSRIKLLVCEHYEVPMPYQKYQRPPILVRYMCSICNIFLYKKTFIALKRISTLTNIFHLCIMGLWYPLMSFSRP